MARFKSPSFVKESTTTSGTGSYTLGGAVDGFTTFAAALSVGDTFPYVAHDETTGYFEAGIGKLTDSTTIERVAILEYRNVFGRFLDSSDYGGGALSPVNWDAGERAM